jgi:hypothetical protein
MTMRGEQSISAFQRRDDVWLGLLPATIQDWLKHDYLAIVIRARKERAEIHGPRTVTQSMIASLTNQGKLRCMVYGDASNVAIRLAIP